MQDLQLRIAQNPELNNKFKFKANIRNSNVKPVNHNEARLEQEMSEQLTNSLGSGHIRLSPSLKEPTPVPSLATNGNQTRRITKPQT